MVGAVTAFVGTAVVADFSGDSTKTAQLQDAGIGTALALMGALVMTILGMVFSAAGNAETASHNKTLTMGALLMLCGILATAWHSYLSGPIYVFSGLLTVLAGAFMSSDNSNLR